MDFDFMMNALTGLLSGGITASIAKFYILRSVEQLDSIGEKIQEIKQELVAIGVKLEHLDSLQMKLMEHDSKIAVLQSRMKSKKFT